jgi:hypothetical protein
MGVVNEINKWMEMPRKRLTAEWLTHGDSKLLRIRGFGSRYYCVIPLRQLLESAEGWRVIVCDGIVWLRYGQVAMCERQRRRMREQTPNS